MTERPTAPTDLGFGAPEGLSATAGFPLAEGVTQARESEVMAALRSVFDPEIPVNIYDLGLIYDWVVADNGDIAITMTLTTPSCPVAGEMPQEVADRVAAVRGVGCVEVILTWEPPWTPERMSEDAQFALGIFGP